MVERVKTPLLACLACAVALCVLVVLAYGFGPFERADAAMIVQLSVAPESHSLRLADGVAQLADPLPLMAMLAAVCALALGLGRRHEALAAVAVVAGANLTTQVLKVVLSHPRYQPYAGYREPWENAFPSGHATAAASIAVALMLAAPRGLRPLAVAAGLVFAGAVGIAVVALEWHYPSDVLGGFLVAAGWGFAALAGLRLTRPGDPSPSAQASSRFAISTK
ncbi:MAG TPA: phosphatase PAP2 family protein [Solirubrobacterales bacterium]|nr:phosphatase PAP2 family protein [Solirubrobacterales bacterium]